MTEPAADSLELLTYPFAEAPEAGMAVTVAPGALWLRMPLPFGLAHINVWAIEDHDGWAIVDTGLQTAETVTAWRTALAVALAGKPVTRVICTHMHPDHIGMAGWLTAQAGCRLWITRLEYLTCRVLAADTGRTAPEDGVSFYRAAGWDDAALLFYKARFGSFGKGLHALPDSYVRLEDGDQLELGSIPWRVVVGTGHSPEHACLYSSQAGLLISGDQVLPRISSNISVFPTEPDADPLADWLESLVRIKSTVPDDVLVLPAHGKPFRGLHARIDQLLCGHQQALQRLRESIVEPRRAVDVFSALFAREIRGDALLGMATGESIAHLNWLLARGLARRRTDDNGVHWYQAFDNGQAPM